MNILIKTSSSEEARKLIEKAKKQEQESYIIVLGFSNEFNRKILENKNVNMLLSPEHEHKKDKLKQRDSGLNHVLCAIAKKNGIAIGIDIDKIRNKEKAGDAEEKKEKAELLARIMQNIKLCKKQKVSMLLVSRNKISKEESYAIKSLFLSLGMPTDMAKEAVEKAIVLS